MMRVLLTATLVVFVATPGFARQEWIEYISKVDLYSVNFHAEPTVREITYDSEFGYTLPARTYTAERGRERYTMTVVDYRGIEKAGTEKSKKCPPGAEPCIGNAVVGLGYWKMDVMGATQYATWKYLQRDAKLTHFMWNNTDLVAGHQLQMTNRDESRVFVAIYMHENRLYIMEGNAPKGAAEPGLFQQSLSLFDEEGNRVRYQSIYYNGILPKPPRLNR
jgi:hypothetical protein